MSDNGSNQQRQEDDDHEVSEEQEEDQAAQAPAPSARRPMTARPRRPSAARVRRISSSRTSFSEPPGAVGGEGSSYTRHLNEQEKRVGGQAQMLLEMFIMDRMNSDHLPSRHRNIVQDAVCQDAQQEKQSHTHDDDYLEDVSSALRTIGDQLSQEYDLNSLIDMVPIQSPREIFMKVCKQMFQDGQFNWGRVVALFYFAYRLITKAIATSMDKGVPWIKEIFRWAIDFFLQYVAWWIIQRGGWRMIQEYWGTSSTTLTTLGVTAILTVIFVWWKQH